MLKFIIYILIYLFICHKNAFSNDLNNSNAYFFHREERCVAIFDFSKHENRISKLKENTKLLELATYMIQVLNIKKNNDCQNTNEFLLLASYIHTTDSYGRPDFSSKTNLFSIEGKMDLFSDLIDDNTRKNTMSLLLNHIKNKNIKVNQFK